MKPERVRWEEQSFWQLVFGQSKVNGAPYEGEKLSPYQWHWPTNTYLQRRRQFLKNCQPLETDEATGPNFYDPIYEQSSTALVEYRQTSESLRSN